MRPSTSAVSLPAWNAAAIRVRGTSYCDGSVGYDAELVKSVNCLAGRTRLLKRGGIAPLRGLKDQLKNLTLSGRGWERGDGWLPITFYAVIALAGVSIAAAVWHLIKHEFEERSAAMDPGSITNPTKMTPESSTITSTTAVYRGIDSSCVATTGAVSRAAALSSSKGRLILCTVPGSTQNCSAIMEHAGTAGLRQRGPDAAFQLMGRPRRGVSGQRQGSERAQLCFVGALFLAAAGMLS